MKITRRKLKQIVEASQMTAFRRYDQDSRDIATVTGLILRGMQTLMGEELVDSDKSFPVVCSNTGDLLGEIDRAIVMKSMKSAS